MDFGNEFSSAITFASSSCLSNGSSVQTFPAETVQEVRTNLKNLTLEKLSGCLEKLLIDSDYDYTDAEIVVEDIPVGVHRCILATRSHFFHELFKKGKDGSVNEGKPQYLMSDLVPYGRVGLEAFKVLLYYIYTGKLNPCPPEVSTCVDNECAHETCGPAIHNALELLYASVRFQMSEIVMLVQRRLRNLVNKALVEDVVPILVAAFHCELQQLKFDCIQRIAWSNFGSVSLEKELPYEVAEEIKLLRRQFQLEAEDIEEVDPSKKKRISKIHKALDCDDVELLNRLLEESNITLDDAYALHYAVAYCYPKIVKEVLALNSTDLNKQNSRGYTVIHVAARRKEPSVLVSLLDKGACASLSTTDGQTAISICRKLTRRKDYNEGSKQGLKGNKDKLCIDILEREVTRNSIPTNAPVFSEVTSDDLLAKLEYYEHRVALARLMYPAEARIAMDSADVDSTSDYRCPLTFKGSNGISREVNSNETPPVCVRKIQARLQALFKTVHTGRRYFPHCSEVLDSLEDDNNMTDILEKGTPEEQRTKKKRYRELKDELLKAFDKDMAEINRSSLSSASSTSSAKNGKKKVRRK